MDLQAVHGLNDQARILRGLEVRERQTTEDAAIEVVVEGVRLGQMQVGHELGQRLLADGERYILNHDRGRDKLVRFDGLRIGAACVGGRDLIHSEAGSRHVVRAKAGRLKATERRVHAHRARIRPRLFLTRNRSVLDSKERKGKRGGYSNGVFN